MTRNRAEFGITAAATSSTTQHARLPALWSFVIIIIIARYAASTHPFFGAHNVTLYINTFYNILPHNAMPHYNCDLRFSGAQQSLFNNDTTTMMIIIKIIIMRKKSRGKGSSGAKIIFPWSSEFRV